MTITTSSTRTDSRRSLAAVLLARRGAVYLPATTGGEADRPVAGSLAGVALLEADLLERGYLLSAGLRHALSTLSAGALTAAGRALLADLDEALGADRDHTPLFRGFPQTTPADTSALYVDRVLSVLLQAPRQPCVLCGTDGSVHALSPCAHLVCRVCFDGTDYSACPVCNRRLDTDEPFLRPRAPRPAADSRRALPDRLRVLAHGGDFTARTADAVRELGTLLARTGAPSPQDTDDLHQLLGTRDRTDLSWLPRTVPGRETKARVLAWLLADPAAHTVTLPAAAALIDTATDVLRLLVVRSGGDAGLVDVPRFTQVPRPLRRALLAVLDRLDPALAVEDMRRHAAAWKHAAERLHPFEHAGRYPRAALAVAVLREVRLTDDALSRRLREAARHLPDADVTGDRIRLPHWPGRVEAALAERDVATAVTLLAQRPGELLRRLDHLLRLSADGLSGDGLADDALPGDGLTGDSRSAVHPTGDSVTGADRSDNATDAVLAALEKAVRRVSPAVLLSALGEIRTRATPGHDRVFFPKGGNAKAHIIEDERAPLPADAVDRTVAVLTGEVLRRAAARPAVELAVVDADLNGVMAPFAERTASRALVTLPRGSELPLPEGRTLRLFLHWMESAASGRTDLDLSAAMYTADWQHAGTCDYTSLRYAETAAVHSGDLTSAPAPRGAAEFVDLDLEQLDAAGVRYVVAVVFAFNNVPFEDLAEAFAGLMVRNRPGTAGPVFDPRQVEQRFDLTGGARVAVPMVIDVAGRTMRWLDIAQGVTGTHHAVHRHADALATLGRGLTGLFTSGARVGLGELATWQAAARARTVVVRHHDGSRSTYRRRDGEDAAAFAGRIGTPATDDGSGPAPDLGRARLAYLLRGDVPLPAQAEVYALHPAGLDAGTAVLLAASDLVTSLAAANG
ncbi:RING finger family 4 domain-containing protein [Streptomyces chrestomyceticus]|uniref:RING finger family 4 domain-containing protein n=1 Tax=Streptomyces chrestomyceticus TaxID=68185 RepID=UPI0033D3D1C7